MSLETMSPPAEDEQLPEGRWLTDPETSRQLANVRESQQNKPDFKLLGKPQVETEISDRLSRLGPDANTDREELDKRVRETDNRNIGRLLAAGGTGKHVSKE